MPLVKNFETFSAEMRVFEAHINYKGATACSKVMQCRKQLQSEGTMHSQQTVAPSSQNCDLKQNTHFCLKNFEFFHKHSAHVTVLEIRRGPGSGVLPPPCYATAHSTKSIKVYPKFLSITKLTLNTKDALKTGLRDFRCTFVSNFFFLSGSM